MTNQRNIIIIGISVVISAGIWIATVKNQNPKRFESKVFKVVNGWGYDILVNDTIVIHQESIPVLQGRQAFVEKEQAEKTAYLVISKMKNGIPPTLTKFDLEKILRDDETKHGKQ